MPAARREPLKRPGGRLDLQQRSKGPGCARLQAGPGMAHWQGSCWGRREIPIRALSENAAARANQKPELYRKGRNAPHTQPAGPHKRHQTTASQTKSHERPVQDRVHQPCGALWIRLWSSASTMSRFGQPISGQKLIVNLEIPGCALALPRLPLANFLANILPQTPQARLPQCLHHNPQATLPCAQILFRLSHAPIEPRPVVARL